MKVAIVSDDTITVSPHFGRAQHYLVYEIQDGKILSKETRPKSSHNHHEVVELQTQSQKISPDQDHQVVASEESLHDRMLSNVKDCEAIIARGMGAGMYGSIKQLGIKPYITGTIIADDAAQAFIRGTLDNHVERLH